MEIEAPRSSRQSASEGDGVVSPTHWPPFVFINFHILKDSVLEQYVLVQKSVTVSGAYTQYTLKSGLKFYAVFTRIIMR
jgi:hypothetical protein